MDEKAKEGEKKWAVERCYITPHNKTEMAVRLPENRIAAYLLKRVNFNTSLKTWEKAACSRGRHAMSKIKE